MMRSDALELGDGPFVSDITCIQGGFGFDQDDVDFLVCYRTVLRAFGHDDKFTGVDDSFAIAKFHAERPFYDQEQFIFVIVMVPDELALEFHGFDL